MKNIFHILFTILAVFCGLIFTFAISRADETLPQTYSYQREYSGWIVKSNQLAYFIKPQAAWSQEAQIEVWRGLSKQSQLVTSLPGVFVISASAFKNSLYILALKNSRLQILQLDSNLAILKEIGADIPINSIKNVSWKISSDGAQMLVLAGASIFKISGDIQQISKNAEDAVFFENGSFAVLEKSGTRNIVRFLKNDGSEIRSVQLTAGSSLKLASFENTAASMQSLGEVTAFDLSSAERGIYARGLGVAAQKEFILFKKSEVVFLKTGLRQYEIVFAPVLKPKSARRIIELPPNLIEPMVLKRENNQIIAIFRNGLITLDEAGEILSQDYVRAGEWFKNSTPEITFIQDTLLLSSPERSVVLKSDSQPLWLFNRFLQKERAIYNSVGFARRYLLAY